jgi:Uma2 family endonuclease
MLVAARRPHYSFREYVAVADAANIKLEFVDGEICAMAGGSPEHAAIAANIGAALSAQLRGKGCRVHSSDLRIRVRTTGLAAYPDLSVVCGQIERDPDDANTVINPKVLVEVLSPSTEDYDRGEKLAHYKRLAGLSAIVLVAWDRPELEVWEKGADSATWSRRVVANGAVTLSSIPCTLDVDAVYRDELGQSLIVSGASG